MTRKELAEVAKSYYDLAADCLQSSSPYAQISSVCKSIATEPCYNHHERGQRIWAFFQALEKAEEERK